jgi:phage baseplate assembly protein W
VPLQKISRGFKDISLSFKRHPVTNDILPLKNEDAIKRSVQNLVRTTVGEVFFNRLIGTNISDALFEIADSAFLDPIQTQIETTIENFEPRVRLTDVLLDVRPDENALSVTVKYDIVGLEFPAQIITFVLQPTRL